MGAPSTGPPPGDYTIDAARTRLGFTARHAVITKVRGRFDDVEGVAHLDLDHPERCSAAVTVRAGSVDTGNEQRDRQLRTNDFFDVPHHPEITFRSTEVRRAPRGSFRLVGDLTVKGVTRQVSVDLELTDVATDRSGSTRVRFEGRSTVNRHDWGLEWDGPVDTGGLLVSDRVTLEVAVSAVRTAPPG